MKKTIRRVKPPPNKLRWHVDFSSHEEEVELLKRKITDYLLVTDPRAGVFRKPE